MKSVSSDIFSFFIPGGVSGGGSSALLFFFLAKTEWTEAPTD